MTLLRDMTPTELFKVLLEIIENGDTSNEWNSDVECTNVQRVLEHSYVMLEHLKFCDEHRKTRFRKKPVVIEAFQMTKERRWDNSDWPVWLNKAWQANPGEEGTIWIDPDAPIAEGHESAAELLCGTLDGLRRIDWNDWIIKGVINELYPCKPDIFEMTYDSV